MRDRYYYKSLIMTLLVYCTLLSGIVYTIYKTGMTGFVVLLSIAAGFLCYFYGIFERSEDRRKEEKRL